MTFALAGLGGAAGHGLGVPAGWLSGAMVGGIAAITLFGLRPHVPPNLVTLDFVPLGLMMGSTVTPATVRMMAQWPLPAFGLILCVLAIIASAMLYLRHVEGWSKTSAFLASMPGALSMLLAYAIDMKADIRPIAFVQTVRLAFLVILLPLPFTIISPPALQPAAAMLPWSSVLQDYVLLISAALAMIVIARRLRLPGGPLVASMIASGLLYGGNVIEAHLPQWLFATCMIVLGAMMAERFIGTTWADIRRLFRASLGVIALGMAMAVLFAFAVARLTGLGFGAVLLAYAPGGVEAMAILAYALGLDPAFVAAMHLFRFLFIGLGLPLMARLVIGPAPDQ